MRKGGMQLGLSAHRYRYQGGTELVTSPLPGKTLEAFSEEVWALGDDLGLYR